MFRKTLFWIHLVCGVVAGVVIGMLSFTGATLAFEKELIAFAERDARRVDLPARDATALPLDEIVRRVRAAHPQLKIGTATVSSDPRAAIALGVNGRPGNQPAFADPYTAELRDPAPTRLRAFLRTMRSWHVAFGSSDKHRATGRAAVDIANVAFLGLAVTGLYLWWPRSWRSWRAVTFLDVKLRGKARDFNWHNAVGFWSAPFLIIMTLTAVPMSYRWANATLFRMFGSEPPPPTGFQSPAPARIVKPAPDAQPVPLQTVLAAVQRDRSGWEQITLRVNPSPSATQAAVVTVKESGTWPRTATSTLSVDPFTGAILKREGFADLPPARQARTWVRFLHTGEAVGLVGQLLAGLACVGGIVLLYTGFALAWRRFFAKA